MTRRLVGFTTLTAVVIASYVALGAGAAAGSYARCPIEVHDHSTFDREPRPGTFVLGHHGVEITVNYGATDDGRTYLRYWSADSHVLSVLVRGTERSWELPGGRSGGPFIPPKGERIVLVNWCYETDAIPSTTIEPPPPPGPTSTTTPKPRPTTTTMPPEPEPTTTTTVAPSTTTTTTQPAPEPTTTTTTTPAPTTTSTTQPGPTTTSTTQPAPRPGETTTTTTPETPPSTGTPTTTVPATTTTTTPATPVPEPGGSVTTTTVPGDEPGEGTTTQPTAGAPIDEPLAQAPTVSVAPDQPADGGQAVPPAGTEDAAESAPDAGDAVAAPAPEGAEPGLFGRLTGPQRVLVTVGLGLGALLTGIGVVRNMRMPRLP